MDIRRQTTVFRFKIFFPFAPEKLAGFACSNSDGHNRKPHSLLIYSVAVRKRISLVPSYLSMMYAEPHR